MPPDAESSRSADSEVVQYAECLGGPLDGTMYGLRWREEVVPLASGEYRYGYRRARGGWFIFLRWCPHA